MQKSTLALSPAELSALVNEVSRRFPGDGMGRVEAVEPTGAWFTLGVFPERTEGPAFLWARWTGASPHFRDVWNYRGAIGGEPVSTADDDLWIGFPPPAGLAGDALAEALAERLVEVHDLLGVILVPIHG